MAKRISKVGRKGEIEQAQAFLATLHQLSPEETAALLVLMKGIAARQ